MPNYDPAARNLLQAMGEIRKILQRATPDTLSDLIPLRLKVMRLLNAHLKNLEERCAVLRKGRPAEVALCKEIETKVSELNLLINSHVARWTPSAILQNFVSYKESSENLQRAMRAIIAY